MACAGPALAVAADCQSGCPAAPAPVCTLGGAWVTVVNACVANCAGLHIVHEGSCPGGWRISLCRE
jgi:hypothetical protein